MKIQIRRSVFETNSSSVHSITMCTEKQYYDWVEGLLRFDERNEQFVPVIPEEPDPPNFKEQAKQQYIDCCKDEEFMMPWDMLSEKQKNNWYNRYRGYIKGSEDNQRVGITYVDWKHDNCDLETYLEKYTTPNGEKIVAFGAYGYN